jgi:hypothetical protein
MTALETGESTSPVAASFHGRPACLPQCAISRRLCAGRVLDEARSGGGGAEQAAVPSAHEPQRILAPDEPTELACADMVMTIRELLALPKKAHAPGRRKKKSHAAHRAWDLSLSVDAEIDGALIAYIRLSIDLPESFSIGLRYQPLAGSPTVLLRVNGDHGPHRNPDGFRFLEGSHIHEPMESDLDLPVSASSWAEGPPFAFVLKPQILRLAEGWHIFCERATIAKAEDIRRIIAKMASGDEQMELF